MGRLCRAIWWHRAVHRGRAEPGLRRLQWVRAERWGRAVCWNRGSQWGLRASQQCRGAGLLQLPSLQQHSCRLELLCCTNSSCHRHFIHWHKPRYHSGAALSFQGMYAMHCACSMLVVCLSICGKQTFSCRRADTALSRADRTECATNIKSHCCDTCKLCVCDVLTWVGAKLPWA